MLINQYSSLRETKRHITNILLTEKMNQVNKTTSLTKHIKIKNQQQPKIPFWKIKKNEKPLIEIRR